MRSGAEIARIVRSGGQVLGAAEGRAAQRAGRELGGLAALRELQILRGQKLHRGGRLGLPHPHRGSGQGGLLEAERIARAEGPPQVIAHSAVAGAQAVLSALPEGAPVGKQQQTVLLEAEVAGLAPAGADHHALPGVLDAPERR